MYRESPMETPQLGQWQRIYTPLCLGSLDCFMNKSRNEKKLRGSFAVCLDVLLTDKQFD